MGQPNIIELNGKRYDAITGVVLGPSTTPVSAAPARRVIDGFIRSSKITHPAVRPRPAPKPPQAQAAPAKPQPASLAVKKMDVSRPSGMHLRRHQPQKGKTLMRHAVRRPETSIKPKLKVQLPSETAPASVKTIAKPLTKKLSVSQVNEQRLSRAKNVSQSRSISRFQPAAEAAMHQAHPAIALATPKANASPSMHLPAAAHLKPAVPKPHQPADIFEAALAHARSHEQKPPRVRRHHAKTAGILAGITAFIVMGGFLAYLNMPGIEMRFASMKVGFSAELPDYKPTGYALKDGVKTDGNQVKLSFYSGDSSYTITQQASDWNSQTLLENYVALNAANHQTVQSQGRTIYIWDGNKAAWVDGGVRYEVSGNAPLSANDIVKLAASI